MFKITKRFLSDTTNLLRVATILLFLALAIIAIDLDYRYPAGSQWVLINNSFGQWLALALINVAPELAGIVIGVVTIDALNERRQNEQLKEQLILQLGSEHNDVADTAVSRLRALTWLSDGTLIKVNLSNANLSKLDLNGAYLAGANLHDANFSYSYLPNANLSEAILITANLTNARLWNANLFGANLTGANFTNANLIGANLHRARLKGVDFSNAQLRDVNMRETDLSKVDLSSAKMPRANLSGADLGGVDLSKSDLRGAILTNVKNGLALTIVMNGLTFKQFSLEPDNKPKLNNADLTDANLSGAHLNEADLQGSCLKNANLSGVIIFNGNLKGAKNTNIEQLLSARSLEESIMPDGRKYEEWVKDPEVQALVQERIAKGLSVPEGADLSAVSSPDEEE